MFIDFTDEQKALREELQTYYANLITPEIHELQKLEEGTGPVRRKLVEQLGEDGWIAMGWPEEYGGQGKSAIEQFIFYDETMRVGSPAPMLTINTVGPTIMEYGTDEQKDAFLPEIAAGKLHFCIGYSEPDAGTDLASLATKAVRDGDEYVINGQKTWTTLAQHADWIFCLVRTNPDAEKPQQGISFLLIDMKTPGITVRPIKLMDGSHEVNETWFDNVKVPVENLIGQENMGWTYAKFLLAHERSGIAGVARSKKALERIKQIASAEMSYGEPLIQDPAFKSKIANAELELSSLEYTELRTLAKDSAGKGPGPESSLLKIKGTDIQPVSYTHLTLPTNREV